MNGFKGLSFASLLVSTLFALSACSGKLSLPKDEKDDKQPAKGEAVEGPDSGTRMQLGLPEDMKDEGAAVPVKEWDHFDDMDSQFGSELLSLSCDGETIKDKEDFKGNVKGVFEVLVYLQGQPATQGWDEEKESEETVSVECKSKGKFDLKKHEEESDKDEPSPSTSTSTSTSTEIDGEGYCGYSDDEGSDGKGSDDKGSDDKGSDDKGSDGKGSDDKGSDDKGSDDKGSDSEDNDYKDSGYEVEQPLIARIVFPYTCEGNAYLSLAVDANSQYQVTANLMTSDLELRYSGTTFVDASLGGLIPLFMEKVEEKKQTSVDIAILFQGDK